VHTPKRFALIVAFCLSTAGVVAIVNVGSAVATGESFVHISNSATQPVPVRVVEVPWQVQLSLPTTVSTGYATTSATVTVPSGKQLRIEFISSSIIATTNAQPNVWFTSVTTTAGGVSATTNLNVGQGYASQNTSQLVRLYADPGSTVTVTAQYTVFGPVALASIPISLSGVLMPAQ
jgi:hypothetical protein